MNRTEIEWCDYTVNPTKGKCPLDCEYCYMWGKRGIGMRFHFDQRIRYDGRAWLGVDSLRKPSRIFVGSTIELFHPRTEKYLKYIFMEVKQSLRETPQHTFLFLTKCPHNLIKFSPFPENCWVGVTATDEKMVASAIESLGSIQAVVRFISVEPLLNWNTPFDYLVWECLWRAHVNWVIIGAQTNPYKPPKIDWVREIVKAADKAGIPVFLKDNLLPMMAGYPIPKENMWAYTFAEGHFKLRQEIPSLRG